MSFSVPPSYNFMGYCLLSFLFAVYEQGVRRMAHGTRGKSISNYPAPAGCDDYPLQPDRPVLCAFSFYFT
jgi:hypothetical protein